MPKFVQYAAPAVLNKLLPVENILWKISGGEVPCRWAIFSISQKIPILTPFEKKFCTFLEPLQGIE